MFTKKLFKLSALLVVLTLALSMSVLAQVTVYVDGTNGDDTFNNGTSGLPYRSITKAITVLTAGSGGTINAKAAIYQASTTGETDPITVNATGKTITFVGELVGVNTTVTFTNGFVLTAGTVNMGQSGTASFNLGSVLTLTAGAMNISTANVILNSGATITFNNGTLNAVPTTGANTNVTFNGSAAITSTSAFLPSSLGTGTLTLSKTSNSAITIDNATLACGPINVNVANTGGVTFSGNVSSGTVTVSAAVPVNFNGNLTLGSATLAAAADLVNSSTGTVTVGATSANSLSLFSTVDALVNEAAGYQGQILNSSTGKIIVNATLTESMKNVGIATTAADGYVIVGTARALVLNSGATPAAITLNGPVNFVNTNIKGTSATINDVTHGALISNTGTGTVAVVGAITTPASTVAFTTPDNAAVNVMLSNTGGGTLSTRAAALRGTAGTVGITNNTAAGTMTLGQVGDGFTTKWDILNDFAASSLTLNGTGALGGALSNNNATSIVTLGASQTIAGVVTNAGKIKLNSNTLTLSGTGAGVLAGGGDIYSTATITVGTGLVKFTGAAPTSTYTGNLPNVEAACATSFSLNGQSIYGNLVVSGAGGATIANAADIKGALNMNGGNVTVNGATTVRGDINMTAGNLTMGTAGITIEGTFNMPQGTFTFGANTLTLKGNFIRTGGTIDAAAAGTGTLAFAGTGPQTFTPGTQMNVYNVTVTNNGQYLASPLITNDIVTINASLIVLKDFTISAGTGGGSHVALGTSNIRMKQVAPANSARFTNGGRGYSATGIGGIIFEGAGADNAGAGDGAVITGTKPFSNIYVRLSTAANNVKCIGAVIVSGTLTLDGGGVMWDAADDGIDLFSTGTLTLDKVLTTPAYPTVVINTVNTHGSPFLVDGGAAVVPLAITDFYNLSYTGSVAATMTATDFVTAKVNNLSLVAGTGKTVQGLAGAMAIAGNLSVDALETLNLANGGAQTLTLSSNSGAHVVNGTVAGGTVSVTGTGATLSGSGSGACSVTDLQVAPATGGTFTSTGMKVIEPLTINQADLVSSITMNTTTATINNFTNTAGTTTLNMAATTVTASGTYSVAAGSVNLTMGGTTATSTIGTALNVTGGTLTLGSNVTVTGPVVHNGTSVIALGNNNLTLTDNYTHNNTATVTAGTGAVVAAASAARTYTLTTGVTIPNFTLNAPGFGITLATAGLTVSNAFVHTAGAIDINSLPLTISGNTYNYTAGTYANTGAAATGVVNLTGSAMVIGGNGSPAIDYVTINSTGTVTVNPDNSGATPAARTITIGQLLTQTKGALALGINDIAFPTGTGYLFTAGSISATSTGADIGELVFSGSTGFTPGVSKSLVIPNLRITAATTVAGTDTFYVANNLTFGTAGAFTCAAGRMILNDGVLVTRVGAGTLSAIPQFAGVVDVTYSGAVTTGVELPVSATALRNLKISAATTLNAAATVNGTLTLGAALTTVAPKVINLAAGSTVAVNAGGSISAPVVPAGAYSLSYASGAAIATTSNEWPATASISNLTVAMTGGFALNLHANRTVTNFTLNCGTGGGSFDLSNGGTAYTLTVTGLTTITSGTLMTTTAGGNLNVQGDVNAAGGTFGATIQMAFTGTGNQNVTTPTGGASIGNITINKTSGSNTVTIAGGDLTCLGTVTFNNGLIKTGADNALVLTNAAGASTGKGYVRSLVTGGKSHVVGNVKQNLERSTLIAFARNEFPVGDTANYRPVALTFLASTSGNFGIFATVSHTNTRPTGVAGLPIADAIATGTPINGYPSFYWTIKTDGSMGSTAFNMDLTAEGADATEVNLADVGANRVKIIRRGGTAADVQNIWNLQGTSNSYDNLVVANVPTVIAVNAIGGLSTAGAIFTYGYAGASTGSKVSGTLTYLNSTNTIGNATVTLTPAAGAALSTTSSTAGAYTFTNVPAGTYTVTASKTGTWGGVTGGDALLIAQHAAGISLLSGLKLTVADVNNSSSVTAGDALLLVRRAVGLDASFVAGDWKFTSQSVAVSTSDTVVNISGLTVGDVNASYVPALGTSFAKTASVSLQNGSTNFGVSSSSAMTIGSATIRIDAKSVKIAEVTSKLPGFVSRITDSGLMFSWFAADGKTGVKVSANEPLISVKLEGKATEGSSVTVETELTDINGSALNSDVAMAVKEIPSVFALAQNYPNPFNPSTTINYSLPQSGLVTLTIYNVMGQEVAKLVNEQMNAGSYSVEWAPRNMASGMYIYRINVQTEKEVFTSSKRLMLLK